MARHFRITLRVAYEEGTTPRDMEAQLRKRFKEADWSDLLDDDSGQSIVETWSVNVDEFGHSPSPPKYIDD